MRKNRTPNLGNGERHACLAGSLRLIMRERNAFLKKEWPKKQPMAQVLRELDALRAKFGMWLMLKATARGITLHELAIRTGYFGGQIALVLLGERQPDIILVRALARGLDIRPAVMERWLGAFERPWQARERGTRPRRRRST